MYQNALKSRLSHYCCSIESKGDCNTSLSIPVHQIVGITMKLYAYDFKSSAMALIAIQFYMRYSVSECIEK